MTDAEVEALFEVLVRLRERGIGVVYVSHRLKDVFDLCATITILKDGRQVSSGPASELTEASLVRQMVGRPLTSYCPDKVPGTELGEVSGISGQGPYGVGQLQAGMVGLSRHHPPGRGVGVQLEYVAEVLALKVVGEVEYVNGVAAQGAGEVDVAG